MTRTAAPPNRPSEPDGPRQVSKFEFNLLRILRFLVGHFPPDQGLQLIRTASPRQECLDAGAVELVKDTLAKACVLFLVRNGGWRNDQYLRDNRPNLGRVWERIPLDERVLVFSPAVLDFLMWATAEKVNDTKVPWDVASKSLTPADELFFWLALDAVRPDPEVLAVLRKKVAFRHNPLCWITFPGDMIEGDEPAVPDLAPLFTGLRAVFLECLQTHLTQRWLQSERRKGQITDWRRMRQQGRAEFVALGQFLRAAEAAGRTDLARFILETNAALFVTNTTPTFWTGGLQGGAPARLAERLDVQRAALALPRLMEVLESWQQRAVNVGYFDEGYQASQMWKSRWEALNGDLIATRARAAVAMLEPLRGTGANRPTQPTLFDDANNPEGSTG